MKTITSVVFAFLLLSFAKLQAQCNVTETLTICDMTTIDGNGDTTPDGIINLYDEYNNLTGSSISLATGTWSDPNFNFALDGATGDLYLWDLDNSSEAINDYQFQLIDTSSACTDGILITLNVVLGAFEGNPLPPTGPNDANITVCEATLSNFNLFQVFESQPSPHENGTWTFIGNLGDPLNFGGLSQDGKFKANIPYVPGGDLIEFDVFEFMYTVPGILPCSTSRSVNFKVEVIRDVYSGTPTDFEICESSILSGAWDGDINLRDDRYLAGEDIEGLWSSDNDATGQISNPLDSIINIREVYDYMKANNPRFNCETFTYKYTVESRSTLADCGDRESEINFTFYEPVRPFQQNEALELCVDGGYSNTINLYDELVFTTENGILYDYPNNECTNWELISGPSNLGLVTNTDNICVLESPADDNYSSRGVINLANISNADAGTYVFRYTVAPEYVCSSSACSGEFADVTVIIHPKLYAGENTSGLQFCETDSAVAAPIDLFSLMTTNGVDDPIYQGPLGSWVDTATGNTIAHPFTLPEINDQQTFDFLYTTLSANGCLDRATLSFTVYEAFQAGNDDTIDVCNTSSSFDLFDRLTGDPNTTGTWSGPNGFTTTNHNAIFDPLTSEAGTYTYTVPDNILCTGDQAVLNVILHQSPNAGSNMSATVCHSDQQIDLVNYLDPAADTGGSFTDLNGTNLLSGSILDVSQLLMGTYRFQYEIQGHISCNLATSVVFITIEDVAQPITNNQTFCASDGATIADLQVSGGTDYNWYDSLTATDVLPHGTVLEDGEDYFVAAVDVNGCESIRVPMVVTILPLDHADCDDCIKDGISPNGDNLNDVFDLCNLPISFPNFELKIFNRYGALVYKGNRNTELFKGVSNASLKTGKELPSGIYFYVFNPNDGDNKPFQGNFYLSR